MWKLSREQKPTVLDTEPFLPPSEKISEEDQKLALLPRSESSDFAQTRSNFNSHLYHIIAIIVNVILAVILLWQIQSSSGSPSTSRSTLTDQLICLIYLPIFCLVFLKEAIRYKQTKFISAENSPLLGTPGPEIDAAWDRLIDDASLRLSESEISTFNSSSIDLQERPGKLAWLEVSHQIHCVVSEAS